MCFFFSVVAFCTGASCGALCCGIVRASLCGGGGGSGGGGAVVLPSAVLCPFPSSALCHGVVVFLFYFDVLSCAVQCLMLASVCCVQLLCFMYFYFPVFLLFVMYGDSHFLVTSPIITVLLLFSFISDVYIHYYFAFSCVRFIVLLLSAPFFESLYCDNVEPGFVLRCCVTSSVGGVGREAFCDCVA